MPKGTVKSFDPEKGFGILLLETGDEIPFDISASNKREPKLRDVADVTVGTGYTGKPNAKLVVFELESEFYVIALRGPELARDVRGLSCVKLGE